MAVYVEFDNTKGSRQLVLVKDVYPFFLVYADSHRFIVLYQSDKSFLSAQTRFSGVVSFSMKQVDLG